MKSVVLLLLLIGLWLAAALQFSLAPRWAILGAEPDFLLVFISVACPYLSRPKAALIGFFAGVAQGAVFGANLTHYTVSRTIAAAIVPSLKSLPFSENAWFASGSAIVTTIVARIIWMFLAAPHPIGSFLAATIGAALYNGVLVLPLAFALQKVLGPARQTSGPSRYRK